MARLLYASLSNVKCESTRSGVQPEDRRANELAAVAGATGTDLRMD